jgi:hypothetical protein
MDQLQEIASGWWGFVVIGGPIILAIALAYGITHSRRRRRTGS